jgi:hypothetical protein
MPRHKLRNETSGVAILPQLDMIEGDNATLESGNLI